MASRVLDQFIGSAEAAERLIASQTVTDHWHEPSALEEYTVAGLAGHLARAVLTVEKYLDAGTTPAGEVTDAAGYLAKVLGDHDPLDSDFHRSVRARGLETAADGADALVSAVRAARERLADRLGEDDALDRRIEVLAGVTLSVEEYLVTRLLELVVHIDDLAVSVGNAGPEALPTDAYETVAALLGLVAARRQGGLAAVRGLARLNANPTVYGH